VKILELISDVGIIIFANLLFLIPTEYDTEDLVGSYNLYICWGLCCFLKFIKLNIIMMNFIVYKVLVKTCLDVLPVMIDVCKLYFIMLFFYGAIGHYVFGGMINTEFLEKYEEITGDEFDEGELIFNFNDFFNSFLFFLNVNFSGYVENFNNLLIVYKTISDSDLKFLIVKLWLYSFFIVTELVLLNILIGFICGLMTKYEENTTE